MVPRVTGYDIKLSVRDAGERTSAEGWVEINGKRHNLRVEASATDRGATYILDGKRYWWNEVPEIDKWFEDRWQEAAKHWNEELGELEDFTERMTSEMEDRS